MFEYSVRAPHVYGLGRTYQDVQGLSPSLDSFVAFESYVHVTSTSRLYVISRSKLCAGKTAVEKLIFHVKYVTSTSHQRHVFTSPVGRNFVQENPSS